jgi:hypothetical protein
MKTSIVYLTLFLFLGNVACAQDLKAEYQKYIKSFITHVKSDNKVALSELVSYPLKREYPIADIDGKAEFVKRYSEIFDVSLKKEIIRSNPGKDWYDMGLRGLMLNQGSIWLDTEGRLIAVNYRSKFETDLKNRLMDAQKRKLDPSIAFFQTPVCILQTAQFKIRIDNLGNNNYRYASWSIKKDMTEKPDLVINGGKLVLEGVGGNHQYEFKKGVYLYECAIVVVGEKNAAAAKVTLYQGSKVIFSQNAKIIAK